MNLFSDEVDEERLNRSENDGDRRHDSTASASAAGTAERDGFSHKSEVERDGTTERERRKERFARRRKGGRRGERDSTRVSEIEPDRGERERRNKERKRRTDLRRSAPNNDSRPRSVAREPRSREHLSVSLAPPRGIPAFLRVCFDLLIANLNWHVIREKESKVAGEPARQENSIGPRRWYLR